jgi:hypothetical protein
MQIKTENLTDAALDWAVAQCRGLALTIVEGLLYDKVLFSDFDCDDVPVYNPSTNWTHGGPIIEREKIDLTHYDDGGHPDGGELGATLMRGRSIYEAFGPTPLIAAMRVYVMSRLGDEVDVPDELCA